MFSGCIGVYVFCRYVPVCLCSISLLGTWSLFYVSILGMFVYLCLISSLCVSLFGRNGLCLWRAHVSLFVVDTYMCLELPDYSYPRLKR